jgi:Pretoxin HINT domain
VALEAAVDNWERSTSAYGKRTACVCSARPASKAPLRVTPNHLIWAKGLVRGHEFTPAGWIAAGQLRVGHTLAIGYFGNVIVTKVRQIEETARVYNVEVNEFHTYFARRSGSLQPLLQ